MSEFAQLPSQNTLERAPERVSTFLHAASRHAPLFSALSTRGYDAEFHKRGAELLAKLYELPAMGTILPSQAREAIVALDAWDEPNFDIARATLRANFSTEGAFMFSNLTSGERFEAVLGVQTFLKRLGQMEALAEGSEASEAQAAGLTPAGCRGALDALAKRGIDAQERRRLAALIETALSVPTQDFQALQTQQETHRAHIQQTLISLHLWWEEASALARAATKRRDFLVWLGLGSLSAPSATPKA